VLLKNGLLKQITKDLNRWCQLNKFVGKKLQIAYIDMDVLVEFRKRETMKTYTELPGVIYIDDLEDGEIK
jgi:hypothetical protein